jgi:superfamily I DNA/RNA helicase
LFLVGDPHQRIYGKTATLGKSGIDIRGRGRKLRVNYRTTEEIRKGAVGALAGQAADDLDGGSDDQKGYHSLMHGPAPLRYEAKDFAAEVLFLAGYLENAKASGVTLSDICIVARTKDYCAQVASQLGSKGWTLYTLDGEEDRAKPGQVRMATMHRVKGLEFDRVIVTGLGGAGYPLQVPMGLDAAARERWQARERSLLYVSMTRARREVVLCYRPV